jgi:hypothetical protein
MSKEAKNSIRDELPKMIPAPRTRTRNPSVTTSLQPNALPIELTPDAYNALRVIVCGVLKFFLFRIIYGGKVVSSDKTVKDKR